MNNFDMIYLLFLKMIFFLICACNKKSPPSCTATARALIPKIVIGLFPSASLDVSREILLSLKCIEVVAMTVINISRNENIPSK